MAFHPRGVSVSKVDIPVAPDDIRVTWNAVAGATWYEIHHATPGTQFDFEATVSDASYLDEWPNVLYPDSYIVPRVQQRWLFPIQCCCHAVLNQPPSRPPSNGPPNAPSARKLRNSPT